MAKSPNIQALSDDELLKNFLNSSDNIFLGHLLERYVRFVFVICMKYLHNEQAAKDMSMQVFEKVTTDVHRFEIQNFKSWLHVVTKNSCLMYLRDNRGFKKIELNNEKVFEKNVENSSHLHHDSSAENEVQLNQLERAIVQLEPAQKTCIELFYLDQKSYKEVSDITGFTLNEVKSYIQNGKRNLKNMLMANGNVLLLVFLILKEIR